jgi:low affinity Fe/Cu permease
VECRKHKLSACHPDQSSPVRVALNSKFAFTVSPRHSGGPIIDAMEKRNIFTQFAQKASHFAGTSMAFSAALGIVLIWAVTGPIFHFSDTWQLVINTGTTIVTFLMVFLIQNSQNRDNHAMELKLDELLRSGKGAHNSLLDIEELSDEEILKIKKRYEELAKKARKELRKGGKDTNQASISFKNPKAA